MFDINLFIEQINKKDAGAYHLLYKKYYKPLVYYATQQINSLEAAEDIVQELFIHIWEKNLYFENITAFQVFLYNSIKNASLNYIKHKNIEINYIINQAYKEEQGEVTENILDDTVYRQLFEIIDSLPERCREVFLMYMKGKKNKEISEALNISIETVKTHKKRAITSLKKKIDKSSMLYLVLLFNNIL